MPNIVMTLYFIFFCHWSYNPQSMVVADGIQPCSIIPKAVGNP